MTNKNKWTIIVSNRIVYKCADGDGMSAGKPSESLHTVKAGGFSDMLLSPLSFAAQQLVQVSSSGILPLQRVSVD
ncbi:MAG: hypothetical protein L6V87_11295 [Ruminococcus sp.]|nr:MAG: hypothetical protein L6V87_11295 [Ruminococcus sp.]